MLLHLGFLATSPDKDWQPILDSLAGRASEYHRLTTDGKPKEKSVQKWIDSAGVRLVAANRGAIVLKQPGALVVLLKGAELSDPCCLALFQADRGKIKASILDRQQFFFGSCIPDNAAKVGSSFVVSGLRYLRDKPAMAVAYSFALVAGTWRKTGAAASGFATDGAVRLRFDKRGRLQPADAFNLTTPPHLYANFGTSFYRIQHHWTFTNGVVREAWSRPADTPYTQLDALVDCLVSGDQARLRRICADEQVFKATLPLRERFAQQGRPTRAVIPDNVDPNKATTLGLDDLRTNFHFARRGGRWVVTRLTPMAKKDYE